MNSRASFPARERQSQPILERLSPSSGVWPTGVQRCVEGEEDPSERITTPAPAPAETLTTKVPAVNQGMHEVHIPPAPMPFTLTPRGKGQSGHYRAEIVAEWVKLSEHDPRVE